MMDDERLAMLVLKNLIELTKTKVLVLLRKNLTIGCHVIQIFIGRHERTIMFHLMAYIKTQLVKKIVLKGSSLRAKCSVMLLNMVYIKNTSNWLVFNSSIETLMSSIIN